MIDTELLRLNSSGFIPGPSEDEVIFLRRVAETQKRMEQYGSIPRPHWEWAKLRLRGVFDFEPACLPAFYSNRSLAPWQGAASWIEGGRLAAIQLRETLRRGSYFGYGRDEILAHEAVHAARSAFNEPVSEEFFAYMISEKWWRRAFGPIIRHPWEVWPFLLGVGLGMFFPAGHLAAACWAALGCIRLSRLHRRMGKAGKTLMGALGARDARAVLFRLTDEEVKRFSRGEEVFSYASRQKCLRWRLIRLAYLNRPMLST